jgi:hypothetical protein
LFINGFCISILTFFAVNLNSKMNEVLEVLGVQGARIGLKINVKNTKSLRLGISEDEKLTLS